MAISESLGDLRTLEIEDGRIECRICGEGPGPAVVFLHGIIANADVCRRVVSDLASDHRCVAPDWSLGAHRLGMRPGTDFSLPGIARMVERFLVAAGLDQVVLVANDTGGAVAQYVAAAHPQRIAGLVLTPCDAFDNSPPPPIRHLRLFGRTPWGLWLLAQTLRWSFVQRLPIAYGPVGDGKLNTGTIIGNATAKASLNAPSPFAAAATIEWRRFCSGGLPRDAKFRFNHASKNNPVNAYAGSICQRGPSANHCAAAITDAMASQ